MPKLSCPCGYVHNLSPIPDDGWLTIQDKEYEKLIEAEIKLSLVTDREKQEDILNNTTQIIISTWGRLYECPDCGRIMWEKPSNEGYKIFLPETSR